MLLNEVLDEVAYVSGATQGFKVMQNIRIVQSALYAYRDQFLVSTSPADFEQSYAPNEKAVFPSVQQMITYIQQHYRTDQRNQAIKLQARNQAQLAPNSQVSQAA